MAANYVQQGAVVTVVSPSGGVSSGDGVLIGSLFGVATASVAAGADLEIAVEGVFELPCNASDNFTQGAPVYWDATAGECVDTATTDKEIGLALAPETAGHVVTVLLVTTVRADITA